jgi:acetylornithine deacetylase/succinyl-diaminopimelate desuccinylase-like protein
MDKLNTLEKIVETKEKEYLQYLFTLLRQESISTQNIGIAECAELLQNMMHEIGIHTRLIETDGHPVVYGEIITDPNAFTLLIYGHYDVQSPEPLHKWESPPFEPTIRDGKIFARGAGDNKGQLIAQLMAIKTYKEHFSKLPINLKLVFEGEEEKGSPNLASFVEAHQDLLKADLVYTSDGSSHSSGSPLMLLGVRGALAIEMKAYGADWDNHSGNAGNIVPNPSWKLIDVLKTMRNSDGKVLIKGFYDNIIAPSQQEKELLRKLPFDKDDIASKLGYTDLNMDGVTYYHKLTMEPTFNIGGITSGYGGDGIKTIIPSHATVKMDIRLVVNQDPGDIYEKIVHHVHKVDSSIEVNMLGSMLPSRTPANLKPVKVIAKAMERAYKKEPLIQPSLGGSLPDYVWTKTLKTPSIIVPYANFDQRNHSPNENIRIDYFLNGIKCTCHVIHALCYEM